MSPVRKSRSSGPQPPATRPLTPRSVVASLLLGMHPPRLRGALLVRWCAHLGISEGTTRVALSRMVDAGELRTGGGRYELAGLLRRRQGGQDWALTPVLLPWDGDWTLWLVRPGARSAPARAELRRATAAARLAELRDGVWARPANLPPGATPAAALATLEEQATPWTGRPGHGAEPAARELFALDEVAGRTRDLLAALAPVSAALEDGDGDRLGPAFALGAASLQQIRHDPLLPSELTGSGWPGPELRAAYERYQIAFSAALTEWFAAERSGNELDPAADRPHHRT